MTIVELADIMLEFGAWDALNFDGGGSTTMVVDGRVVNSPADAAGERAVGNALLVTRKIREQ
jgi:exopolysaccharide biosynthesis protein